MAPSNEIDAIIRDHTLALQVDVLGEDAIPHDEYIRLVRTGVIKPSAVDHAQVSLQAAHTVGKTKPASDAKLARMSPAQFWHFVSIAPPQFDQHDLDAITAAKEVVGHAITNLGHDLIDEYAVASREASIRAHHDALATVQHEIGLGIARESENEQIVRRLRRKLGEADRNWQLVVTTELHNAQEHGTALTIMREFGPDALVYKLTQPNACRYCVKLYRMPDGRPRIFRLRTLVHNGTNVGRKAGRPTKTEWKAVIGCTHPACQCTLYYVPKGKNFDASGKLVDSLKKAIPDDLPENLQNLIHHQCEQ